MTFAELKTEFFARGTDYLNEDSEGVARAERWLNQAYREILNLHSWRFLQTSATGTASAGYVSIPDLRKIRFVVNTDAGSSPGQPLQRVSLDDLVRDGDTESSPTGTPVYYYVDDSGGLPVVQSFPLGGTLKVYYIKRVGAMVGADDAPVFDEEYHNLIVDRAMIKAYVDSDNFEAAAALRQESNVGLSAMAEDYLLESREVQFLSVSSYDG